MRNNIVNPHSLLPATQLRHRHSVCSRCHCRSSGPEIWEDTIGNIDVLVAGIGTGGTVTGTGRYLKMMNTNIKVVGVEPADRSIISGDNPGFMPNILNIKLLDEVIKVMVGLQFEPFIEDLTSLVKSGEVPISRIDDAVERILRMKFAAGRFEFPFSDRSLLDMVGCKQHRDLAREAVRKSLVLLKNRKDISKPFLPLDRKAKRILVAGTHADDLGFQCGGWTKTWYGCSGRITIDFPIL
ncbi:uncharacterized protein LOC107620154 isoform X2 [Arachis ipaensis]|nr:uncharacterized protein LOC107620154 isoform X2 [Arachis ipaensis]XP_025683652.1 uncharacterized protein LOC112784599 isoform X2 [Arachis hypogaea]